MSLMPAIENSPFVCLFDVNVYELGLSANLRLEEIVAVDLLMKTILNFLSKSLQICWLELIISKTMPIVVLYRLIYCFLGFAYAI